MIVATDKHALAVQPIVRHDLCETPGMCAALQPEAAAMSTTDAMAAHTLALMSSGHAVMCVEPTSLIAMCPRRATAHEQLSQRRLSTKRLRLSCVDWLVRSAESCDGTQKACDADVIHPRGHVCRDKNGPCDVADLCPGGDIQCPPDAKEVVDTPCRPAVGICDVPELCDGSSKLCPADEVRQLSANFVCRDANGDCDLREICDGSGPECPTDKFAVGMTCRATALGNTCDVPETCARIVPIALSMDSCRSTPTATMVPS
jgi:hypothetical protein